LTFFSVLNLKFLDQLERRHCKDTPYFRPFYIRGDSLRQIPFSHGTFLRHNGAQERSIILFTDLHSYWLSLRVI
jgi:hypothetical protein